jgi:hypothetical protein
MNDDIQRMAKEKTVAETEIANLKSEAKNIVAQHASERDDDAAALEDKLIKDLACLLDAIKNKDKLT